MDEVHEILKAIMARLEAADAERAGFRREVMGKFDAIDSELQELRAEVTEFRTGTHERLEKIEEHLDYLIIRAEDHVLGAFMYDFGPMLAPLPGLAWEYVES